MTLYWLSGCRGDDLGKTSTLCYVTLGPLLRISPPHLSHLTTSRPIHTHMTDLPARDFRASMPAVPWTSLCALLSYRGVCITSHSERILNSSIVVLETRSACVANPSSKDPHALHCLGDNRYTYRAGLTHLLMDTTLFTEMTLSIGV